MQHIPYTFSIDSALKKFKMLMNRLLIYPKDIQVITGRSDRYGRNLIKKMKDHFKKQSHQIVTIDEFATYMGLNMNDVLKNIR
ncbi:hypothetical protein BH11BAC1_BH11BAC1_03710 [soil metagenome]